MKFLFVSNDLEGGKAAMESLRSVFPDVEMECEDSGFAAHRRVFRGEKFDGAIIHVVLSDMNGFYLVGMLRRLYFRNPIFIMTGRYDRKLESKNAGATDGVSDQDIGMLGELLSRSMSKETQKG